MAKRPISAYSLNRAMTNFARTASKSLDPRFMVGLVYFKWKQNIINILFILILKGENILFLELDMPNRTTKDYESPTLAPHLQAALDNALKDEDEIVIDEP